MIESRTCPECGGEIIFTYETPTKTYSIEDGDLVRADNNMSDDSVFIARCSNDTEHDLAGPGEDVDFWTWVDSVEMYFYERGIYER